MDKSIHEKNLSHPLQTDNKLLKLAVTFSTGYNAIFIIRSKTDKFCFTTAI